MSRCTVSVLTEGGYMLHNFSEHRPDCKTFCHFMLTRRPLPNACRGGKLSALAAVADPRVAAVCLIDAVDNTQYAPLGPG